MSSKHVGVCKKCGKETEYRFKSRIKDYCSHACANAANAPGRRNDKTIEYKCDNCSCKFSVKERSASYREKIGRPPRFCCMACSLQYAAAHAIRHVCPVCNTEFTGRSSRRYCSRGCAARAASTPGSVWSESGVHDRAARAKYMREYVEANRGRHNECAREWWAEHREQKYAQQVARRGAGRLSVEELSQVYERDRYRCVVCCSQDNLQVDHVVPVARGGRSVVSNLQILCATCNQSKGSKEFISWIEETYGVDLSGLRAESQEIRA